MTDTAREWQCAHCGAWVDAGWWRHAHAVQAEPSLAEMSAARAAGTDPFSTKAEIITYLRTGDEPMREKPL